MPLLKISNVTKTNNLLNNNTSKKNQTAQPNAAQQLTNDFQQALNAIHHTDEEADLGVIYKQFKSTRYEAQIVQACKAKKDMRVGVRKKPTSLRMLPSFTAKTAYEDV